jgi:hypothetical protein
METTSVMKAEMLGASLDMKLQSLSRFDKNGRLNHLRFEMDSGGRRLEVTADFLETEIHAEAVAGGAPTKRVIPIPEGALIVEDPTIHLPVDGIGMERLEFYIFDPNSLSLLKASAERKPDEELEVEGEKISARVIEINDPRAKMNVYLTMDGVFVKATGPLGMVLLPESREEAMRLPKGPTQTDIATASSIVPDKPIRRISRKKSLKLKVSGIDLAHLPSGTHQTIEKQGSDWLLTLHPTEPSKLESELVSEIKPSKWTKPDFRVPSDSKEFKELAQKLIKPDDEVLKAAEKVRKEVLGMLRVNAGIGVMRDAAEILETKEGVCRDHAVVMAAILRAGNVPTRLIMRGWKF